MKPNFSGDYVLNRSASVLGPAASAIVTARIRLTHDEPRFGCSARFASDADAVEFTVERFTDGRAASVNDHNSSAAIGMPIRSFRRTASAARKPLGVRLAGHLPDHASEQTI